MKESGARRIEPLFNDVFVRVFGSRESFAVTRSLVNAILRMANLEEIGEIDELGSEETDLGSTVECKSTRYDVRIVSGNRVLDLEAQRQPEEIADRALFYGAKLLTSSLGKGDGYESLPRVTVIVLLDTAPAYPDGHIVRVCQFDWRAGNAFGQASDRMEVVLVELSKVRQRYNELSQEVLSDESLSWLYVLTTGFDKEADLQTAAEKFPTLEEFAELYGYAINDPKITVAYDLYEEGWREEHARQRYLARLEREATERGMEKGLEKGMAEGLEKGMAEGLEKGLEKGMAEGLEKGMAEGLAEGLEKGMAEGLEKGLKDGLVALVRDGLLAPDEAAKRLDVTLEELDAFVKSSASVC